MKRFTVWLCVLCLTLGLASCSSQVNDGSVSTESGELSESVESTVYSSEETSEEVFDPFTVELTDSSTGKTSPRLVETIYPTEVHPSALFSFQLFSLPWALFITDGLFQEQD